MSQQFASDNNAGICPAAFAALIEANAAGHAVGYGDDAWTAKAKEAIRALFEAPSAEVFFVFNGTAANALALAQICKPYNSVIAHAASHLDNDEAGACSFFSGGATLMTADTPLGKLTPEAVERLVARFSGVHHVKARAVSITQSTEMGTVYTLAEFAEVCGVARRNGLKVHMDGARLANAIATLGCTPAEAVRGVDVLSFGGTKNGLGFGEAVVFFDASLAEEFDWRVKQAGQLNSKMRLATAPWLGLLGNGVWLANARHANQMALRLRDGIGGLKGVKIMFPVEANAVFADIDPKVQAALRAKGWTFYTFLGATGCRLMCAWDTQPETVDHLVGDFAAAAKG
ncbi:MAG: threonine aldolase family protein [Hyphomicrobiaceae bacterium]